MSWGPPSADRASSRLAPPRLHLSGEQAGPPPRLKQPGIFHHGKHGNARSGGTETVGERDPKDDSTAILPLKHASDLSTFRREHILAKSSVLHCLWRKVQIARAGYFESRVADATCLQGFHDTRLPNTPRGRFESRVADVLTRLPNTPRGRFELFAEGNGSPMATAMPGSWRKVLKSPAYWRGMFAVGEALRAHFHNRFPTCVCSFRVFRGEKIADRPADEAKRLANPCRYWVKRHFDRSQSGKVAKRC